MPTHGAGDRTGDGDGAGEEVRFAADAARSCPVGTQWDKKRERVRQRILD